MADNHGYIKVPRQLREAELFADLSLAGLLLFCMLYASGSDYRDFRAGEFYVSQTQLAKRLRVNRTTITTKLRELEQSGFLQISSSNEGTCIHVCNWEVMQNGDMPSGISIRQPLEKKQMNPCVDLWATLHTGTQQPPMSDEETNKNNKKKKEKERRLKELESTTTSFFSPQFDELWNLYPEHRRSRKDDAARLYAEEIARGVSHEKILNALNGDLYRSDWTKEQGKYVPGICKWLERADWRDSQGINGEGDDDIWATF